MAVIGDTLPHCSGTGVSADPYIFTDAEGFMEAIDVEECYMEAGTSNMTFDCNDGIVTAPLVFKYASLNAKGLTILNLTANQTYEPLITMSGSWSRTTKNLNIYNFCCIMYGGTYNGKSEIIYMAFEQSGAQAATANFLNCNFAGIRVGYNQNGCMFGKYASSSNTIVQPIFTNCTFNVNFSDPTAYASSYTTMFNGSNVSPVTLINSTICLSGTIYGTFVLTAKDGSYANNPTVAFDAVTVTNTQTNQLTCGKSIRIYPKQYGYNYYKLWVTVNGTGSEISDSLGLINISRLTGSITLNGIQMQETDPSASDYIYNDTNLANAGFLVGQVIT